MSAPLLQQGSGGVSWGNLAPGGGQRLDLLQYPGLTDGLGNPIHLGTITDVQVDGVSLGHGAPLGSTGWYQCDDALYAFTAPHGMGPATLTVCNGDGCTSTNAVGHPLALFFEPQAPGGLVRWGGTTFASGPGEVTWYEGLCTPPGTTSAPCPPPTQRIGHPPFVGALVLFCEGTVDLPAPWTQLVHGNFDGGHGPALYVYVDPPDGIDAIAWSDSVADTGLGGVPRVLVYSMNCYGDFVLQHSDQGSEPFPPLTVAYAPGDMMTFAMHIFATELDDDQSGRLFPLASGPTTIAQEFLLADEISGAVPSTLTWSTGGATGGTIWAGWVGSFRAPGGYAAGCNIATVIPDCAAEGGVFRWDGTRWVCWQPTINDGGDFVAGKFARFNGSEYEPCGCTPGETVG